MNAVFVVIMYVGVEYKNIGNINLIRLAKDFLLSRRRWNPTF
jgi:hypothetical protein